MPLRLGVLEQTIISKGVTPNKALQQTIELAQYVEKLGYHRFWVSEHHNDAYFAGSSPEILIAHIASKTEKIRVGSGGIMLSNYSPYKVAENFKVLEGLTPKRIDLGIGRAPGGNSLAIKALRGNSKYTLGEHSEKIDSLLNFLSNKLPENHIWAGLKATPLINTLPEVWILGTSISSAIIAAQKGLPYSLALFLTNEEDTKILEEYIKNFRPSSYHTIPKTSIAVTVICGDTKEDAERIASSVDYLSIVLDKANTAEFILSPEEISYKVFNDYERSLIEQNRKAMIVGDINYVEKELIRLSNKFKADEIIINTIAYDFNDKLKSFKKIAERFLYLK